jgi:hypothetical protein
LKNPDHVGSAPNTATERFAVSYPSWLVGLHECWMRSAAVIVLGASDPTLVADEVQVLMVKRLVSHYVPSRA